MIVVQFLYQFLIFSGTIGVLAVFVGSPLLYVFDVCDLEKLYPLPDTEQIGSIVLSAVFGELAT